MELLKFENEISIPQAKALFPNGIDLDDEVFLIDNVKGSNLPKYKKVTKCIVIIICEEGEIRFEENGKTIFAKENDVILLPVGQYVNHPKVLSSKYKGKAILVNQKDLPLLAELFCDSDSLDKKLYKNEIIKLNRTEMGSSINYFEQITTYANTKNHHIRFAFAITLVKLILQTALVKRDNTYRKQDKTEDKFHEFIQLVDENVLQNLPVEEYCQRLDISRTFLETITHKYLLSFTPSEYIHLRLIYCICIMARNTSKEALSTKDIALRCHFSSSSALTRFVKKEIHMSLTTFRNLTPDKQLGIIHHTIPDQILL